MSPSPAPGSLSQPATSASPGGQDPQAMSKTPEKGDGSSDGHSVNGQISIGGPGILTGGAPGSIFPAMPGQGQWPSAMHPYGVAPNSMDLPAMLSMLAGFMSNPAIMAAQGLPPMGPQWTGDIASHAAMSASGVRMHGPAGALGAAGGPLSDPGGRRENGAPGALQLAANGCLPQQPPPGDVSNSVIDPRLQTIEEAVPAAFAPENLGAGGLASLTRAELGALVKAESQAVMLQVLAELQSKRTSSYEHIPQELKDAVHTDFRLLMGVVSKVRRGRGRKKAYVLPEPLEFGKEVRRAPDNTRLFNPDWHLDVDVGVNEELVTATVELIVSKAAEHKISPALAQREDFIKHAVTTYFNTLKRQYIADHEEEAGRKRQKKMDADMHHSRLHRKADTLRVGIPAFRRAFGYEETAGIEEVVLSAWQSEEHSSDGKATPAVREKYRKAAGVGPRALEVRPLTWRSRKLTMLYIVLAVFARFVRDCEDIDDVVPAEAEDVDPASQAAKTARAEYLAKVIAAAQDWNTVYLNSWQYMERFRGPAVNAQSQPRRDKKHKIYKECISDRWAGKSAENTRFLERAPEAPATFNIFGLDIPEVLIPEGDLFWLNGMDESSDSESDSAAEGA